MIQVSVPELPSMDEQGFDLFSSLVNSSLCYMEYGSGGSTVYVSKLSTISSIISIESDNNWMKLVSEKLNFSAKSIFLRHCDIGETIEWGAPKSNEKINLFHQYAFMPWILSNEKNLFPDTILIDGRFRVSSFLVSLLSSRVGTRIMFDDYFDRPEYWVAERFCDISERRGRMALFISGAKPQSHSMVKMCEYIARHSILWG